ncbi:MAG: hypothetical protein GF334_07100 [Candidatus Altiarchaeales archaeon]|nr:hypothetical protein [Candidatus Altiarchaeales archaeon]
MKAKVTLVLLSLAATTLAYPFFFGFTGVKPRYDETGLYKDQLVVLIFSDVEEPIRITEVEAAVEGEACINQTFRHYKILKNPEDARFKYKQESLLILDCPNNIPFDEHYTAEVTITYSKFGQITRKSRGRVAGLKKAHSKSHIRYVLGEAAPDNAAEAGAWILGLALVWYLPLYLAYKILKRFSAFYCWPAFFFTSTAHLLRTLTAVFAATTRYNMPDVFYDKTTHLFYPATSILQIVGGEFKYMIYVLFIFDSLAYYLPFAAAAAAIRLVKRRVGGK